MYCRIQIKNATIVNEGRSFVGSVIIDNDRIDQIIPKLDAEPEQPADEVFDATGCYLLPGVIDEHVHFRAPGLTHKADFSTESLAAAAGGVTTILDMPNTLPVCVTRAAVLEKLRLAEQSCHVNFGCFIGATRTNIAQLRDIPPHLVAGIKLFMGSSTGAMEVEDDEALTAIFEQSRLPIMVHCEDNALIAANMKAHKAQYGDDPAVVHHPAIRSAEACYRSTAKAVELARQTKARLHVAHITTARELELFDPTDQRITAEACLPHLIFSEEYYLRLGSRIKCNPAVKSSADREALRAALTNGRIRCIGTDHAPHLLHEKTGGAARAASGMPFVQFSLVSMLDLVDKGVLPIEQLVELMCHNPARVFRIENRGFLRLGYMADLVLVRPHSPWTLTPNRILSKCNWSPMEGHTFHWRVERTYVNGNLLYNKGHITDEGYRGRMITYMPR